MNAEKMASALRCGKAGCQCARPRGNVHCPAHDHADLTPSLTLHTAADGKLLVHCKGGCSQDAVVDALKERRLWPSTERRRTRAAKTKEYEIRDASGNLVAIHERKDLPKGKKTYMWRRLDGTYGLNGLPTSALPLYGCEKLRDLPEGELVVVTEGEKAADALMIKGFAAVGTVTGASGTPGDEALSVLLSHRTVLWPDNDEQGRAHMEKIAHALHRLGHRDLSWVTWEDAPHKGDGADFDSDDQALRALLDSATKWEPPPAIDLAALLDEVDATIRKYIVLTAHEAIAVALWVAHTHAIEAADVTPYLNINSPEKRSGKTRLLEVLRNLVARPWMTARTSPAALYRRVDAESPTFLSDESDSVFKSGDEYSETLRCILNSGFERGGSVTVCVGQGKDIGYKEFSTFCPKAIAGIGRLPDTIADRSISIAMKRQSPGEKAEKLRRRRVRAETEPLREQLTGWALAAIATLTDVEPTIPSELDDRASDGWEPLLAIADMAGAIWPARARAAALALSAGDGREDDSLNVRLLADIWTIFEQRDVDRLAIADLVAALVADEEAPWPDLRGKPLSTRSLGWRLKGYGIKATTVRLDNDRTARGYHRETFRDAVSRYVPEKASQTDTTDTLDRDSRDGSDACVAFKSDTPTGSDTEIGHDVSVVTDVPLSLEACGACGSTEIDGYTIVGDIGEPRCFKHLVKETDSAMVRQAVEQLGLSISDRRKVEHP